MPLFSWMSGKPDMSSPAYKDAERQHKQERADFRADAAAIAAVKAFAEYGDLWAIEIENMRIPK